MVEQMLVEMCQMVTFSGAEEAIIAHRDETFGQDVLQKTADEFFGDLIKLVVIGFVVHVCKDLGFS